VDLRKKIPFGAAKFMTEVVEKSMREHGLTREQAEKEAQKFLDERLAYGLGVNDVSKGKKKREKLTMEEQFEEMLKRKKHWLQDAENKEK